MPALSDSVRACGASSGRAYYYRPVLETSRPADGSRVVGQIGTAPWTTPIGRAQNGGGLRGTPGDSGGPVFVYDSVTGTVRIFGIISQARNYPSTGFAPGSNEVTVLPLAMYFTSARNRLSTAIATS